MSKKRSKIILLFLAILIVILLISLVVIFTTREKIEITGNIANINLNSCEKITVSYLNYTKTLDDEITREFLNQLSNYDYPVIKGYALVVSDEFKIDFQNGIIINFGQSGTDAEVSLNGNSIIITKLPENILNTIRDIFNQHNYETNEINVKLKKNLIDIG